MEKDQSVSAFVRLLLGQAYEQSLQKSAEDSHQDFWVEPPPREAIAEGRRYRHPKHPLHKIASWRIDALGAPHIGERSEAELIGSFAEKVGQLRPQLVTLERA